MFYGCKERTLRTLTVSTMKCAKSGAIQYNIRHGGFRMKKWVSIFLVTCMLLSATGADRGRYAVPIG